MPNTYQHDPTTPHIIKLAAGKTVSEMRKTFKAVLGAKTQLTHLSFLAGLMVVLMFGTPFLSLAQQQNPAIVKAIAEGELNATAQTNRFTWFVLGIIGGPITVAVTALQKPALPAALSAPPAGFLLGKSVGYTEAFAKAYEAKAKNLRLRYATIGCVTGTTLGFLGYTLYDRQQYGDWWWETW